MRVEKKLEEEVKYTDDRIFETGKKLKAKLIEEYCISAEGAVTNKPIYKKKSAIVTMCCVFVCLLVVGICLPIFLDNDKPIHYLKENEVTHDTTLETIYENVAIQINEDNYVVTLPTVIEDSISGDTLAYRVKVESVLVFPYGEVYYVTNKNYVLFEEDISNEKCIWNEYNVSFKSRTGYRENIPTIQVTGCLEYDKLRVYFTYTDVDLGEPVTPISFLDSLFNQ